MNTCQACRFFADDPGVCRRHPPTLHGFPKTTPENWCGQFQPVTAVVIEKAARQ